MNLKQQILESLMKKPHSISELEKATNKKKSNIESRISELRKMGYTIKIKPVTVNKYVLEPDDTHHKISEYINNNNLFNVQLPITRIARAIEKPVNMVENGISKLFTTYNIVQVDKTTVVFFPKRE